MSLKEITYNEQSQALLDEKFLATLSEQRERDIYARIISLDINENPVDQIEGKISSGSINIDGSSSIRRTCNLTMVSDNIDINDFYWGVKTKFKLEIGLRNRLTGEYAPSKDSIYPEIVWFPQGYYIIATFNTSIATNSCTISLSGKDKMCLLNGDLGGQLFASVDFGQEEEVSTIMEEVTLNNNTSSEGVLLKDYYIKVTSEDATPETVLANNPRHVFVYNKNEGIYYKKDNFYILDKNRTYSYLKYYDMYKLVDNPNELYKIVDKNIVNYIPNYYYYYIDEETAVQDSSQTPTRDRQYYIKREGEDNPSQEVEIYAADKYYYLKYNDTNAQGQQEYFYYILDSNTKRTNPRNYYQMVPLYQKFSDITTIKIPIEKIIREAVHTYAKEPYYNILINDLDDYGLEQLTYKGEVPLYALYDVSKGEFTNLMMGGTSINPDFKLIIEENDFRMNPLTNATTSYEGDRIGVRNNQFLGKLTLNELGQEVFKKRIKDSAEYIITEKLDSDILYTVAIIEYGTDVGYRLTDLTYPGDLIANIGETLTSVLDKIKTMLSDFEYFYDENGKFVFQRKKTYINISWSQLTDNEDEDYVTYANDKQKFSFNFEGGRLISAIQNSPILNNLRNDFTVWGKRKGISGADIPIHVRYAIDKKPVYYKNLNNNIYTTDIKYAIQQESLTELTENLDNSTSSINISNFTFDYQQEMYGLPIPEFDENTQKWSPGWWDIRDWAKYYKLLKNTNIDPNGTMKFYSTGDEHGCVPISSLPNNNIFDKTNDGYVWLIVIDLSNPAYPKASYIHGNGIYDSNQQSLCVYYESPLNGAGQAIPTEKTRLFPNPYAGCSDQHTYQFFLNLIGNEEKKRVFFYNPNFPFGENVNELITEQKLITKYQELEEKYKIFIVDWREIIYQMALDYFAGQGCSIDKPLYIQSLTEQEIINGVPQYEEDGLTPKKKYYPMTDPDYFLYEVGLRNPYYYPTGYTGYEQYYTDMQGFWRQLYNPDYIPEIVYSTGKYKEEKKASGSGSGVYAKRKVWYPPQIEDYNIEFYVSKIKRAIAEQKDQLDQLYNNTGIEQVDRKKQLKSLQEKYERCLPKILDEDSIKRLYWNYEVFAHPESLNFWIDFFDSDSELAQFSIPQVGDRSKVVNESKNTAIIYTEVPNFILYDKSEQAADGTCDQNKLRREITEKSGQNFIYLPQGFSQYFSISYRTASLKDRIDELVYQFGYCVENITITAMPVYYLKPNTRIFVQDKDTGINGEYIVSKLTLPLGHNGTMSITASKAPERLY